MELDNFKPNWTLIKKCFDYNSIDFSSLLETPTKPPVDASSQEIEEWALIINRIEEFKADRVLMLNSLSEISTSIKEIILVNNLSPYLDTLTYVLYKKIGELNLLRSSDKQIQGGKAHARYTGLDELRKIKKLLIELKTRKDSLPKSIFKEVKFTLKQEYAESFGLDTQISIRGIEALELIENDLTRNHDLGYAEPSTIGACIQSDLISTGRFSNETETQARRNNGGDSFKKAVQLFTKQLFGFIKEVHPNAPFKNEVGDEVDNPADIIRPVAQFLNNFHLLPLDKYGTPYTTEKDQMKSVSNMLKSKSN